MNSQMNRLSFDELSAELVVQILAFCHIHDVLNLEMVSKYEELYAALRDSIF